MATKKNVLFIMPYGDGKKVSVHLQKGKKSKWQIKTFDFDRTYSEFKEEYQDRYAITIVREQPGMNIYDKMYKMIHSADIVVADITGLEANVMYELGARHALRNKITFMVKRFNEEKIPFDISVFQIMHWDFLFENFDELVQQNITKNDSPIKERISSDYNKDKFIFDEYEEKWTSFSTAFAKLDKSDYENWSSKNNLLNENKEFEGIEEYDQKKALVSYKLGELSNSKSEIKESLNAALEIIEKHDPMTSQDFETIGLYCSILERIYKVSKLDDDFSNWRDAVNRFISSFKASYSYGVYAKFLVAQLLRNKNLEYFRCESKIRYDELVHLQLNPDPKWKDDTIKQYEFQSNLNNQLSAEDFEKETSKKCFEEARDAIAAVNNG